MARELPKISNITPLMRHEIRRAVDLAKAYWPNAGGPETPRENIRSAFRMIRNHASFSYGERTALNLPRGVSAVANDAYAHADM